MLTLYILKMSQCDSGSVPPGVLSLGGLVGHRLGTRLWQPYPTPPGRLVSSWPTLPPVSERTGSLPVCSASPRLHSESSPAPAALLVHTPVEGPEEGWGSGVRGWGTVITPASVFILLHTRWRDSHLRPSVLRESGEQRGGRLFFSDERRLQVVYGMALVLSRGQTQAADQRSILHAVHVQWLPVVLGAGGGAGLAVPLVLRQWVKTHSWTTGFHSDTMSQLNKGFHLLLSQWWLAGTRWWAGHPRPMVAALPRCDSWGISVACGVDARWSSLWMSGAGCPSSSCRRCVNTAALEGQRTESSKQNRSGPPLRCPCWRQGTRCGLAEELNVLHLFSKNTSTPSTSKRQELKQWDSR